MTREEKLTRLLEMQEHPECFTEEEIRRLMADEECRQLYNQMVRATDAIFMEGVKDEEVQEPTSSDKSAGGKFFILHSYIKKIAAVFVGVLMLSGIAYAAIHLMSKKPVNPAQENNVELTVAKSDTIVKQAPSQVEESEADVRIFQDMPLDDMARELAAFYKKEVVVKSKKAHALRLYYKWNRADSLDRVVADLNHFDRVHLAVEDGKLIVKP